MTKMMVPPRLSLIASILLASFFPLAQLDAQQAAPIQPCADVLVRPSATGHVAFTINIVGFSPARIATLQQTVPQSLGCRWAGRLRNAGSLEGVCRAWLESSHGVDNLPLAPLTTLLHQAGIKTVTLEITPRSKSSHAPPSGWKTVGEKGAIVFVSDSAAALPPDPMVRVDAPFPLSRILAPVAIILVIPTLIVLAVRLHAIRKSRAVNWLVYANWINLCAWLYWITAMNAGDLGEFMVSAWFDSYLATFVAAALLYSLPPLLAVALCVIAMAPVMGPSSRSVAAMLKRRVLSEAVLILPFSIFLVGIGLSSAGWGYALFGLVVAYIVFRILVWFHWSQNHATVTSLEGGDLFERAACLAKKAGVTLSRLSLLRTNGEANAFAVSGDAIMLTENLVSALPPREVEAIIAHELGHHKSGHLRFNPSRFLFWGYLLAAEPLLAWLVQHCHAPQWFETLPIAPLLFMMLQGHFSQRREFAADAHAVEMTGDPEGSIAALARLARLSNAPTNNNGIFGSIMSHPSIQARALAVARRFGVSEERAMAILANPDEVYRGTVESPVREDLVVPASPLFSLRERALFSEQLRWVRLLAALAGGWLVTIAITLASSLLTGTNGFVIAAAGSLCVLAFTLGAEILWAKRMVAQLRRKLTARLEPQPGSTFVGLHPGRGVRFTEGFPDWDFGFVTIEGDWLCYRGEKTRFAIARQEITGIDVVSGPITWLRERRVQVTCEAGSFTLSADVAHPTKSRTARLAAWLAAWDSAATTHEPVSAAPEPQPNLPRLPGIETTRVAGALLVCGMATKLILAAVLMTILAWYWIPASIVLMAPLAGFLRMLPRVLWPVRRPSNNPRLPSYRPRRPAPVNA